jgi:hypothetical protein
VRFADLAALKQHLISAGQNVIGEPDGFMLSRRLDGRINVVRVTWGMPPGVVHFFTTLRGTVPPGRRAALLEAVNEFNHDAIPGFHLTEYVVYAVYAFLDGEGGLDETAVNRCLELCADAVIRRGPVVQRLIEET